MLVSCPPHPSFEDCHMEIMVYITGQSYNVCMRKPYADVFYCVYYVLGECNALLASGSDPTVTFFTLSAPRQRTPNSFVQCSHKRNKPSAELCHALVPTFCCLMQFLTRGDFSPCHWPSYYTGGIAVPCRQLR